MKKTTKIASIALIAIITPLIIISIVLYYPKDPQTDEPQVILPASIPPEWQVKVSGNTQQEKTWSINELTKMPLTRVIAEYNGVNATFGGVALIDFLEKTGSLWDTGEVKIESTNGKNTTLNIYQAWNSTAYPYYKETNRIVLAFIMDGKWLTEETDGPVKLITPSFGAQYQIENVAQVKSEKWSIKISGGVFNPLTITSDNLTSFGEETVTAAFVPGDGERISDWTGISVLNILEIANKSPRAERITVVAIDGYTKTFTLKEVEEANMLIGFAEKNEPLDQNKGGPYRIFCPVEKYKWAQFWVKFVSEIIVS